MADIIVPIGGQLPSTTKQRYRDMGDGTHALVVSGGTSSQPATADLVVFAYQGLPNSFNKKYADQGDGTHALVIFKE